METSTGQSQSSETKISLIWTGEMMESEQMRMKMRVYRSKLKNQKRQLLLIIPRVKKVNKLTYIIPSCEMKECKLLLKSIQYIVSFVLIKSRKIKQTRSSYRRTIGERTKLHIQGSLDVHYKIYIYYSQNILVVPNYSFDSSTSCFFEF